MLRTHPQEVQVEKEEEAEEEVGVAEEGGQHKQLPTLQGVSWIVSKPCCLIKLLPFKILMPNQEPISLLSFNSCVTALSNHPDQQICWLSKV